MLILLLLIRSMWLMGQLPPRMPELWRCALCSSWCVRRYGAGRGQTLQERCSYSLHRNSNQSRSHWQFYRHPGVTRGLLGSMACCLLTALLDTWRWLPDDSKCQQCIAMSTAQSKRAPYDFPGITPHKAAAVSSTGTNIVTNIFSPPSQGRQQAACALH
jgi:hypothetical protein